MVTTLSRPSVEQLTEFRERVRDFVAANAPAIVAREGHRAPENAEQEAMLRQWFALLFAEKLIGADWPVEHGGDPDHHPLRDRIVAEEIVRARAPRPVDQVNLAAHVILHFGTEEQKRTHLPPIRRSEDVWCQLLSEPDAGSDIAAVRTRGVRQPDGDWIISGAKLWITDGHWADKGLALVRTDPDSRRHKGLTVFVVPMRSPGVQARAIRTIGGAHEVNEVVLDDVRVGPDAVVGDVGSGWSVIMAGLDFERFGIGGNVILLELLVEDLVTVARLGDIDGRPAIESADIRHRLATFACEVEAAKAFIDDHVEQMLAGNDEPGDSSIAKLSFADTYHRLSAHGTQLSAAVECGGRDDDALREARRRLRECWLWSRAYTVSGGSSEMMRNILSKRRLRLPSA
ncbi:acyl-CoA dehydrogenase family protein [uncultured Williamsia sp.]|uniref:acyl-CoA dehydrogenase family protein n=1 Tax=uncultured Williamsia sp. TaxID=259311 RepID=UPI0026326007|nr:acyl-CoA dehydrogenase family protein [uncultured Williamsia sp.]